MKFCYTLSVSNEKNDFFLHVNIEGFYFWQPFKVKWDPALQIWSRHIGAGKFLHTSLTHSDILVLKLNLHILFTYSSPSSLLLLESQEMGPLKINNG